MKEVVNYMKFSLFTFYVCFLLCMFLLNWHIFLSLLPICIRTRFQSITMFFFLIFNILIGKWANRLRSILRYEKKTNRNVMPHSGDARRGSHDSLLLITYPWYYYYSIVIDPTVLFQQLSLFLLLCCCCHYFWYGSSCGTNFGFYMVAQLS